MKRIFHISNRVDIPEPGVATAGGLDEAIADAPAGYEVVRFGWSGKLIDKDVYSEEDAVRSVKRGNVTYITYDMTKEDLDGFYNGTANSFLWPLFHFRVDVAAPGFNKDDNKIYDRVNHDVAERAKRFIRPDDVVIVHDYHFLKMGKELTSGPNPIGNPVGFFLHIPTPNSDLIEDLEDRQQQLYVYSLMEHLYDFDFVGLQSQRDVNSLHTLIGQTAKPQDTELFETQTFRGIPNRRGHHTTFGAFPVAGNTEKYSALAKQSENSREVRDFIHNNTPDGIVDTMSVDRLDYSKGLVAKARGVGRWLHEFGNKDERIHLLQIAPPGRTDVRAYQDEILKTRTAFQDVNEIFGDVATLHLDKVARPVHLGLARNSNIGLITPLRDGYNLYIGEYLAAQKGRENPGVAVASKFAGAAAVLNGSIVTVDPRRPDDIARGIQAAQMMGAQQRQDMLGRAIEIQTEYSNERWQRALIDATKDSSERRLRGGAGASVALPHLTPVVNGP